MPDVRLAKDHKGKRRGDRVKMSDKELQEARDAGAVLKIYPSAPGEVAEVVSTTLADRPAKGDK